MCYLLLTACGDGARPWALCKGHTGREVDGVGERQWLLRVGALPRVGAAGVSC